MKNVCKSVFENLNPTGKWGKNTKRNAQKEIKMFLVNSKNVN